MRLKATLLTTGLVLGALPFAAHAQDAEFCAALNGVMASQANHFKDIRGDKVDKDEWEAMLKLDHATHCTVEKSDGTMYYDCEFDLAERSDPDADKAAVKNLASAYVANIVACRPEWHGEPSGDDIDIKDAAGNMLFLVYVYSDYFGVNINDE